MATTNKPKVDLKSAKAVNMPPEPKAWEEPVSQRDAGLMNELVKDEWEWLTFLADIHDMEGEIAIGDTMRNPKFLNKSSLEKFDLVAANPMWNQDGFDEKFYDKDEYNRFGAGYPPASSADWGWVQHMFASLDGKGRAAIVLDTGAVSRGSGNAGSNKEKDIRKWFVDHDHVEGVLLLPENLFYNTTAPAILLILNKAKPKERRGNIILVNASTKFKKGRPKNFIPDGYDETGKYDAAHDVRCHSLRNNSAGTRRRSSGKFWISSVVFI